MTPPDRREIVDYLAALDPAEYQKLVIESRGAPPPQAGTTESRAEYVRGTQARLAAAFDDLDRQEGRK
ncbi:hypothetical protein [Rhodococcus sp. As11]|uniref:hypothetical protein n=1 Tax=Rhodococcus sp. As11 TaxID=3029189 RepID=UPI003B78E85F